MSLRRFAAGLSVLFITIFSGLVLTTAPVSAATAENCGRSGGFLGFPTWYKYLDHSFDDATKQCNVEINIRERPRDIGLILAAVVEMLLRVAMLLAIGFVLFGGLQFIMSQGEPDRLTTARSTIINALIGLAVAIAATGVVTFVAGRFN